MRSKTGPLILFVSVFAIIQLFSSNILCTAQSNTNDMDNALQENISEINTVRALIYDWGSAWRRKDIGEYISYYSSTFQSKDLNYAALMEKKSKLFKRPGTISLEIFYLGVIIKKNYADISFIQRYKNMNYLDIGEKNIALVNVNGKWKIISEEWKPIDKAFVQVEP
jgi:murein L,D-transpeptidase YafK